jgi:hypothetical protein
MVEAMIGRILWGISESLQNDDVEMETLFKYGEKNRSA